MILEDHLHISLKRRHSPLPLFKLQINLLTDLVTLEKSISAYEQAVIELQASTTADSPDKGDPTEEIDWMKHQLHFYAAERRAIRDIADGIAWRLFDYDRMILRELANRPGKKHINLQGIAAELQEFGRIFNSRDGIAVLNDLTHFLKLGDITVRKDTGTFEIVEVKAGSKKSGRITRQKQDLRQTVAFFNTGEQEKGEGRVLISELDVNPETFNTNIRALIDRAQVQGVAADRIGDHLIVECIDFPKAVEFEKEKVRKTTDQTNSWAENWAKKGDMVMGFGSLEKYVEVRNFAPFSIFPLPEIARVKLMTGGLSLNSYVNVTAVLRYLEQKGWKVLRSPEEHIEEVEKTGDSQEAMWVTVGKGPFTCRVPWFWLGRLAYEFLKPRTLVSVLEAQLARGPTDAERILLNLAGESQIWD